LPIRAVIYTWLEHLEDLFNAMSLKTFAKITHFVLQMFRIQCIYDISSLNKAEVITRILQIALNLGQLEGQLGICFPINIEYFICHCGNIKMRRPILTSF
jgi:PIN domain nuclease of toxin-antitoxin system